jgi:predicted dehydrogenase
MLFEFENGLKAAAHCAFNSAPRSGYRIVGETGIIEVDIMFNAKGELGIQVIKDDHTDIITVSTPDNYMLEVEQFGRCILDGEAPHLSLDDSYGNAVVIDKVLAQIKK